MPFKCYISAKLVRRTLFFSRSDYLRPTGTPNEYFRLNLILYVHILSGDQNNFARVTSEPKKTFKGYISAKTVIRTLFLHELTF